MLVLDAELSRLKNFSPDIQCNRRFFEKKLKKVIAGKAKGCIFAARKRRKRCLEEGIRMRREIFESLRPAQDIRPVAREGVWTEDKEPEKVEESGAHETEVN